MANKVLNQFQEQPESFSYCDFILENSQNIYTKVFALGIIENAIKTKWNLLEENNRIAIRNFIVDILIKNVTDNNSFAKNSFFINKLNIVLVLIAKNEWTTTWTNFISELCTSSKTNQNLCENNMKVLQLLSEEINEFWKNSLTTKKAYELKAKMAKEFSQVFYLCQFIFDNASNVKQTLLVEAVKLFAEYTTWFPLEFVFNEKIITQFLQYLKSMNFIRVEVIKCIGQIFAINYENKLSGEGNAESYYKLKNYTMQIYKSFIEQMVQITNKVDFSEKHRTIEPGKLSGFERLTLQFELALINFFKNNTTYIESFDFPIGTSNGNEFLSTYMNEIVIGLNFLTQFQLIQNDEIFKAASDFWYWFVYKIFFIKIKNLDPEGGTTPEMLTNSINTFICYTNDMFCYRNFYSKIFDKVRNTIVIRMNKPLEVKIDIDENGDLTTDPQTNTIYQSLHDTLKMTLIYLTHLDPIKTQDLLKNALDKQLEGSTNKLDKPLLNSISWSVGCIAGSMDEMMEKKFVVAIIRTLLTLCEQRKGKENKAICASNIMYVVGQYPRFLNAYWKFLKTVVKKLFEFMHEYHPGVQDFACETFLKISMKCAQEFIKINEGENEPYINVLVREVGQTTNDLFPHQKLMFYEALGNMINIEVNEQNKMYLIEQLMQTTSNNWMQFFEQAKMNADVLKNTEVVKALELIIRINERVCYSTGQSYWNYGSKLFENMLKTFLFYSEIVNQSFNKGESINVYTKAYQSFNKTLLKFFCTLVTKTNTDIILSQILPGLGQLIEEYTKSHQNNRDPNVLLVFSKVLEKIRNTQYNYIVSIWNYLCLFTLNMIKNDYQSFPEHRMNFFILLKSLISYAFDSLFQVQESNFNKDVIDAITWAIRHNQPLMYETGLETLLILIRHISEVKIVNGINIVEPFCKAYYFSIMNDVFYVLTDSYHKAGFKLQVEIIQSLIYMIEVGLVTNGIFEPNVNNKVYVMGRLSNLLGEAFQHLNKNQIDAFCLALFNKSYNTHEFKTCIRDFLISLKSFSGNNDELYAEEKKAQLEEAKLLEEKKKSFVPGMMPVYDNEMVMKINSANYQDDMNMGGNN